MVAAKAYGLCRTHYMRERRGGRLPDQRPCEAPDCNGPAVTLGYCDRHYQRLRDIGSLEVNRRANSYRGVHGRIVRIRGKATNHTCVDCGRQAEQWSYDHGDPNEKLSTPHGYRYSLDIDHYDPRCIVCHLRFDRLGGRDAVQGSNPHVRA